MNIEEIMCLIGFVAGFLALLVVAICGLFNIKNFNKGVAFYVALIAGIAILFCISAIHDMHKLK